MINQFFLLLLLFSSSYYCHLIVTVRVLNGPSGEPVPSEAVDNIISLYTPSGFSIGSYPVLNITVSNTSTDQPTSPGGTEPTTPSNTGQPTNAQPTPPNNIVPSYPSPSNNGQPISAILSFTLLCLFFSIDRRYLIFLTVVSYILCTSALQSYDNCKLLDTIHDYRIYWTLESGTLKFAQSAKLQNGWLAVGISPNGEMNGGGVSPGSDIILGYMGADCPKGCIGDYSTIYYDKPVFDTTQDVTLVASSNTDGVLQLEWTRPLNTNHADDQPIDPSLPFYLIWSLNDQYTPTNKTVFSKHTEHADIGILTVLNDPSTCPGDPGEVEFVVELETRLIDFDPNTFTSDLAMKMNISANRIVIVDTVEIEDPFCPQCLVVEITFPNYLVPSVTTTYVSYGYKLPDDKARSIIRIEPILNNSLVLHHMVLFQVGGVPESLNKTILQSMPGVNSSPMYAWAPGGDRLDLPPQVGYSVATGSSDIYLVLNHHYNNPGGLVGEHDSSGVRLYLDEHRQFDAGFFFIGEVGGLSIPPNSTLFRQGSNFTIPQIPMVGIIFAAFPHMHLIGKKIWTEQRRNGEVIQEFGKNLAWDFNSQKIYTQDGTIEADDVFTTQCLYTNPGTTTVVGGESTFNEMCLVGIVYYPSVGGGFVTGVKLTPRNNCDYPCPYLS